MECGRSACIFCWDRIAVRVRRRLVFREKSHLVPSLPQPFQRLLDEFGQGPRCLRGELDLYDCDGPGYSIRSWTECPICVRHESRPEELSVPVEYTEADVTRGFTHHQPVIQVHDALSPSRGWWRPRAFVFVVTSKTVPFGSLVANLLQHHTIEPYLGMMALFFDPPEVPERIDPSEYDEVWRLIRTPQGECISLVVFDAATGVIRTKQHSESVAAFVAELWTRRSDTGGGEGTRSTTARRKLRADRFGGPLPPVAFVGDGLKARLSSGRLHNVHARRASAVVVVPLALPRHLGGGFVQFDAFYMGMDDEASVDVDGKVCPKSVSLRRLAPPVYGRHVVAGRLVARAAGLEADLLASVQQQEEEEEDSRIAEADDDDDDDEDVFGVGVVEEGAEVVAAAENASRNRARDMDMLERAVHIVGKDRSARAVEVLLEFTCALLSASYLLSC